MPLSLTVTDLADGTGATATIAGSDAGSTNTVYVQAPGAGQAWTSAGSRTGDGAATLALAPGYYFAHAQATLVGGVPAISSVVGLVGVTEGTTAKYKVIVEAVAASIQAMTPASLPGLPYNRVHVRWSVPNPTGLIFPLVFVLGAGEAEHIQPATNQSEDWGWPVVIQIADRNDQDDQTNKGTYALWRERLIKRFLSQRLLGVPDIFDCAVEPGPIFDKDLPLYQFMVSGFTLRLKTRERRGVGGSRSGTEASWFSGWWK